LQGRKQHSKKRFLSFQLSDCVPVEGFYRRLKEILDLNWQFAATKKYYRDQGQA
jgi:hypothetical protein